MPPEGTSDGLAFPGMKRRTVLLLGGLIAILVATVALRLVVGPGGSSMLRDQQILELRATRVGVALVVGAALAVSGVYLQTLLRNPLASPDLLGLASGASLGVVLGAFASYRAGLGATPGFGASSGAAIIGALAALALVYALSRRKGLLDPVALVLVGVIVAVIASALADVVKLLMPDGGIAVSRLLVGAIREDAGAAHVLAVGGVVAASIVMGWIAGPSLDAASLDEHEAASVGVHVGRLRAMCFILAGLLAAGGVVLAGPVGFVGLICPHAARMLAGPSHRVLIVSSALAGAILMVGADAVVRVLDLGTGRIPVGVVTSLIGGPLLVWLVRDRRRAGW